MKRGEEEGKCLKGRRDEGKGGKGRGGGEVQQVQIHHACARGVVFYHAEKSASSSL